jgi:hypothetical protein
MTEMKVSEVILPAGYNINIHNLLPVVLFAYMLEAIITRRID